MAMMIFSAISAVFWAGVFASMLCYMFAIFFMSELSEQLYDIRNLEIAGLTDHKTCQEDWVCRWVTGQDGEMPEVIAWRGDVAAQFGTMGSTMNSLVASISGGSDWMDVGILLWYTPTHGAAYCVFVFFVVFMVFGLLNILTGVVLESTVKASEDDRESVIEAERENELSYTCKLKQLLESADTDGTKGLSWEELHEHLNDTTIRHYLKSLEIVPSTALSVFQMLQKEDRSEVTVDDYIDALLHYQGPAMHVDVAKLIKEATLQKQRWAAFVGYTSLQFKEIQGSLDTLQSKMHIF